MLSCQSQPAGLGVNFSKYFWNCLLEGPSSILSSTYFIAITGQFAHFKYTRIQAVKELVLLGRSVRFRIIRLASLTPIKNLYSSVIIAKWITEWKESPNTSGRLVRWHQLLISAQFSKDENIEKVPTFVNSTRAARCSLRDHVSSLVRPRPSRSWRWK